MIQHVFSTCFVPNNSEKYKSYSKLTCPNKVCDPKGGPSRIEALMVAAVEPREINNTDAQQSPWTTSDGAGAGRGYAAPMGVKSAVASVWSELQDGLLTSNVFSAQVSCNVERQK